MLSPNRINFIVDRDTLVEEHIVGVPGDQFILRHLDDKALNRVRLAKEFVKFNERTFARLLGDMHSSSKVHNSIGLSKRSMPVSFGINCWIRKRF